MTTTRYAYQDPATLAWVAQMLKAGRQRRLAQEAADQEQRERAGGGEARD